MVAANSTNANNELYLKLVKERFSAYNAFDDDRVKREIGAKIIKIINGNGGRFLDKQGKELSTKEAVTKTMKALKDQRASKKGHASSRVTLSVPEKLEIPVRDTRRSSFPLPALTGDKNRESEPELPDCANRRSSFPLHSLKVEKDGECKRAFFVSILPSENMPETVGIMPTSQFAHQIRRLKCLASLTLVLFIFGRREELSVKATIIARMITAKALRRRRLSL